LEYLKFPNSFLTVLTLKSWKPKVLNGNVVTTTRMENEGVVGPLVLDEGNYYII